MFGASETEVDLSTGGLCSVSFFLFGKPSHNSPIVPPMTRMIRYEVTKNPCSPPRKITNEPYKIAMMQATRQTSLSNIGILDVSVNEWSIDQTRLNNFR